METVRNAASQPGHSQFHKPQVLLAIKIFNIFISFFSVDRISFFSLFHLRSAHLLCLIDSHLLSFFNMFPGLTFRMLFRWFMNVILVLLSVSMEFLFNESLARWKWKWMWILNTHCLVGGNICISKDTICIFFLSIQSRLPLALEAHTEVSFWQNNEIKLNYGHNFLSHVSRRTCDYYYFCVLLSTHKTAFFWVQFNSACDKVCFLNYYLMLFL